MWLCTNGQGQGPNSSDSGGCYVIGNQTVVTVNSGLMLENSSYFITVKVTKDQRQAQYTQQVSIVPGDPSEVQIRYKLNVSVLQCYNIFVVFNHAFS